MKRFQEKIDISEDRLEQIQIILNRFVQQATGVAFEDQIRVFGKDSNSKFQQAGNDQTLQEAYLYQVQKSGEYIEIVQFLTEH